MRELYPKCNHDARVRATDAAIGVEFLALFRARIGPAQPYAPAGNSRLSRPPAGPASGRLLPSSPAGRAIGYRQVLDYLLRSPWAPSEGAALVEFLEGFTAASRRYAAQQVKWFRNEPQFEWVEADWAAPETVEQHVLVQLDLERSRFEQVLQAPRQAELRGLRPDEAKRMKTYAPRLRALDDATAKAALLARADACRAQLEPHLEALRAADAELSRRYPWHKECKEGGAGADAEDAEAVAKRLKSGDRGTDGLIISP